MGAISAINVVTHAEQLARYAMRELVPKGVVRPHSNLEVAEIARVAARDALAIVPWGARTKILMGMAPRQYDLAVDMTGLDRILAYDPGDLTLSVEPGVTLVRLASALAEHRQFLPLAVPFRNQATVGGAIASGLDSPLRQHYGTARDFLLGIEFVTGDGLIAKSGGRVVKNVAGYDLHKLMIGGLGTLGILTKVNFRTFPMLAETRAFVAWCDEPEQALDVRRRVAASVLRPLTLEIVSPYAATLMASGRAAAIQSGTTPPTDSHLSSKHWAFICSFAGNDKSLARYERDLQRMTHEAETLAPRLLNSQQAPALLDQVREFIPIVLKSAPESTIVKIALLPTQLGEMLTTVGQRAENNQVRWAVLARGVGVLYLILLPDNVHNQGFEGVARALAAIFDASDRLGGSAQILWRPIETLKMPKRVSGAFRQMQKLKDVFDPHGILAPGRLLGGL